MLYDTNHRVSKEVKQVTWHIRAILKQERTGSSHSPRRKNDLAQPHGNYDGGGGGVDVEVWKPTNAGHIKEVFCIDIQRVNELVSRSRYEERDFISAVRKVLLVMHATSILVY
ncbi:unnamed protein product [Peronospora belbahrii]|uniref:Uncharacterized protein n=1 Tax=Peronospora belbahrii TaxID=622444 RepID=A0ABN8CVT2_9STRA|nr:unnamed protein product [Peronospora belbahrii]